MIDDKTKARFRLPRLRPAIRRSREAMQLQIDRKNNHFREYLGSYYTAQSTPKGRKIPVNTLALTVHVLTANTVSRNPAVKATTMYPQLRSRAKAAETVTQKFVETINYEKLLRKITKSSFFSLGIRKMGLELAGDNQAITGSRYAPFYSQVHLSNFIVDMFSGDWENATFMGDMWRMNLEDATGKKSPFDPDEKKKLRADKYGEEFDTRASDARNFAGDTPGFDAEYYDSCILADIWLPREHALITIPMSANSRDDEETILRVIDWDGPQNGPYEKLAFYEVEENVLPLPPVSLWRDLHELTNDIFNKIAKQIAASKTVIGHGPGARADAYSVKKADELEVIELNHPDLLRTYQFGGVDGASLAAFLQVKQLALQMPGNIETLGGLRPQAETLGQEVLMNQNAGAQVGDMTGQVYNFARKDMRDFVYYLWNFIEKPVPYTRTVTGLPTPVTGEFFPDPELEKLLDYEIDVVPYSMAPETPQAQLQKLMAFFQTIFPAIAQGLAASGAALNPSEVVELFADYAQLPELRNVIQQVQTSAAMQAPPGSLPESSSSPKAGGPQRTYTHRHIGSGANSETAEMQQMNSLLKQGGRANAPQGR